jgi:hypothetical protein
MNLAAANRLNMSSGGSFLGPHPGSPSTSGGYTATIVNADGTSEEIELNPGLCLALGASGYGPVNSLYALVLAAHPSTANRYVQAYSSQTTVTPPTASTNSNTSFLAIDLLGDGVTPNDVGDMDDGPNGLQNYPGLTAAVTVGATVISGMLNSLPGTKFMIELFSNTVGPNFRAGEDFLGALVVSTDFNGNAAFDFTPAAAVPVGQFVTATATRLDDELHPIATSEFSAAIRVTAAVPAPGDFDGDNDADGQDFLVWQRGLGLVSGASRSEGDANGDGAVNATDLDAWKADFGGVAAAIAATDPDAPATAALPNEVSDRAMAPVPTGEVTAGAVASRGRAASIEPVDAHEGASSRYKTEGRVPIAATSDARSSRAVRAASHDRDTWKGDDLDAFRAAADRIFEGLSAGKLRQEM